MVKHFIGALIALVLSASVAHAQSVPSDWLWPAPGASEAATKTKADQIHTELARRAPVTPTSITGTNTYVASSSPAVTTLANGLSLNFKVPNTNSGASTLKLDGTATTSFVNFDGSAFTGGELVSGRSIDILYDGSVWRPFGPLSAGSGAPGGSSGQTQYNNAGTFGGYTPSGDVSVVPSTGVETIAAGAVSNSKLANEAANSFKANNTGSPAAPIDITVAQAKTLLAITPSDVSGLAPIASSGSATDLSTGTTPAARMPALTGDVTSTVNTVATTIAANAVTNAKAAQMAANSVKCNNAGSLANAIDCTVAQINTLINSTVAPVFANITSKPTTIAGYGITDAEGTFTSTTAVSAAGATQGTATAITKTSDLQLVEVTTAAASTGVLLPASSASSRFVIVNRGANALSIYPTSTGTIDGGSASAPITLGVNQAMLLVAKDASNNWYSNRAATYSATAPPANGTASAGTSTDFARADHVHPAVDLGTAAASGTLAAARMLALTGDVTNTVGTAGTTISAAAVTLAKQANANANSVPCNNTGSAATLIYCTTAQIKTLLAIVRADVTDWGTGVQTALGNATNAANGIVTKDANSNISVNNSLYNFLSTATAAGTSTLTVSSAPIQFFTGSTTQTITLPVVSTLALGQSYTIVNQSSGSLTLNSSGSNLVQTITAGNAYVAYAVLTTGTTAASWGGYYVSSGAGTGTVTSVTCGLGLTGGTFTTAGTCASAGNTYASKTSNYTVTSSDFGATIEANTNSITLSTSAAASTFGNGFWFIEKNNNANGSVNTLTFDPNSTETIDGVATSTDYSGAVRLIFTDGTNWRSHLINGGYVIFTATGANTFTIPNTYNTLDIVGFGGGGGGGGGDSGASASARLGGTGGAGGVECFITMSAADVGTSATTVTATVGAGGTSGTAASGSAGGNGGNGGNSTFGSFFTAYGGGGGKGGTAGTVMAPPSGAGCSQAGAAGSAASAAGGGNATVNVQGFGFTGSGSQQNSNTTANAAEYGGAQGGGMLTAGGAGGPGGTSMFGGPGGGAGAGLTTGNAAAAGGAGGNSGTFTSGGGGGGAGGTTAGTAGTAGSAGNTTKAGQGGGGGGVNGTSTCGAGANGGAPAAGAGGGAACLTGTAGGVGGVGGRGELRLRYSWLIPANDNEPLSMAA